MTPARAARLWLNLAFAASGVAGLVYETVLQRELARTFGVTAWAAATVLAAYMGGLALGAGLCGRRADRASRPLWLYAALEAGIALCVLGTPAGARALTALFVRLAHGQDPGAPGLMVLRLGLALAFTLVPTTLMGATLPAIARGRAQHAAEGAGEGVGWLYTLNLLGAALGAALATYAALPRLGLVATLASGAALNLAAAAIAFAVGRAAPAPAAPAPPADPTLGWERAPAWALWGLAAWSGLSSFAYEVVWTHLLAIVVGNSAYAFGLMLAMFLLGLTLGSLRVARRRAAAPSLAELGAIQVVTAAAVVLTLPLWDRVPALFASVGPHVKGFAGREAVRALVCVPLLSLPALLLGSFFPLLLRHLAERAQGLAEAVGRATALNTLGSVLGSLLTGFLLLGALGSRGVLVLLAVAGCAVGALCLRAGAAGRRALLGAWAVAGLALLLPGWNLAWLGSGANVYFARMYWAEGRVVHASESVESGLTTVVESPEGSGVYTLLSNGKFQGNTSGEQTAQLRFAQVPLLFSPGFERALLIGLGSGASAAAMAAAPYRELEVAELSHDITQAADAYFREVNAGVLADPKVKLRFADGRNLLLLSDARYDVISLEVTSIWIAGEADLYNREFYELARAHLAPGGVLQQWVQLHHLAPRDLAVVLNTARQVFPHVALFTGGSQGQMVASERPLVVDYGRAVELGRRLAGTAATRELRGGDLLTLSGELALDEAGVAAYVEAQARAAGVPVESLVSTDDNLYLEYATPRGNALGGAAEVALRASLKPYAPAGLVVAGAHSPAEQAHATLAHAVGAQAASPALLTRLDEASAQGAPVAPLQAWVRQVLAAPP